MKCQLGVYRSRETALEQWDCLIYLESERTPRNILRDLTPFLRSFHAQRGMRKADHLSAWLIWNLIHRGLVSGDQGEYAGIGVDHEIRGDIDFFFRISPGLVEVHHINQLRDGIRIAAVEISLEPVAVP